MVSQKYLLTPINFELRLLRGYFLIVVVARYGHARIRGRSQDPAGDAAKMLAHLENANTYLAKALKVAREEGVFYCVVPSLICYSRLSR